MAFVAVYDASVLYPSATRDLLIRIAQAGLAQAKWTTTILNEVFDGLTRNRPDLDPAKLARPLPNRFAVSGERVEQLQGQIGPAGPGTPPRTAGAPG